ncbi:MAG: MarR family transcriptional regulator [Methylobacterium frigidaeris]
MDRTRLEQAYTQALLQAGRHWRRVADAGMRVHGVSDATALPLVMIGRLAGEPRQSALAEAVGVEGPSLVRLLDQLEAAGLVARREDPGDRRAKVLSLTAGGRAAVARIEGELAELRRTVFAGVSRADLEAGLRVLRAVQRHSPCGGPPRGRAAS